MTFGRVPRSLIILAKRKGISNTFLYINHMTGFLLKITLYSNFLSENRFLAILSEYFLTKLDNLKKELMRLTQTHTHFDFQLVIF